MNCLFFSGEAPAYGGYLVAWHDDAPSVAQCRPRIDALDLYDWSGGNDRACTPEVKSLSWRVLDHAGHCLARVDSEQAGAPEQAWLEALDLRIEQGRLAADEPGALLFLLAGRLEAPLDDHGRALLARADYFTDYRLSLLGPGDRLLAENPETPGGVYSFREKHDAFIVPL